MAYIFLYSLYARQYYDPADYIDDSPCYSSGNDFVFLNVVLLLALVVVPFLIWESFSDDVKDALKTVAMIVGVLLFYYAIGLSIYNEFFKK